MKPGGQTQPSAVALGFFDGVHLGHAAVIKETVRQNLQTVVVTFSHNPGKTENGHAVPEISSHALKEKILASMGVDVVVYLDFEKVRGMEPNEFISMLTSAFTITHISSGFNYRFGSGACAGVKELEAICTPLGIEACAVAPVRVGELPLSSTRIRALICDGDVKRAAVLLGRPFAFYAEVVYGRQLGRTLGTPTINQLLPPPQILPRFGVYASVAHVSGKKLPAVTNVGVKPTISDSEAASAETYIMGFDGDLYGKTVQVDLLEFIRAEKRFGSIDELRDQINRDAEKANEIVKRALESET